MTTNELRIGNILDHQLYGLVKVAWIGEGFTLGVCPIDNVLPCPTMSCVIADVNSVRLTEEWLKRFGFQQKPESNSGGPEYFIWIDKDSKCFLEGIRSLHGGYGVLCICNGYYFAKNLHYAHELQNLFFSIEKKELELKPEA